MRVRKDRGNIRGARVKVNPIWTGEKARLLEDKALQDEVFGKESELIDGSDMAPAVKAMKGKQS